MRTKRKYKLSGGIAILSKGEFRVGATFGNEPYYELLCIDLYLFKLNVWIALKER